MESKQDPSGGQSAAATSLLRGGTLSFPRPVIAPPMKTTPPHGRGAPAATAHALPAAWQRSNFMQTLATCKIAKNWQFGKLAKLTTWCRYKTTLGKEEKTILSIPDGWLHKRSPGTGVRPGIGGALRGEEDRVGLRAHHVPRWDCSMNLN